MTPLLKVALYVAAPWLVAGAVAVWAWREVCRGIDDAVRLAGP